MINILIRIFAFLGAIFMMTSVLATESRQYGNWTLQNSVASDGLIAAATSHDKATVTLMFDTNHACGGVLSLVVPSTDEGRRHNVPLEVGIDADSTYSLHGHAVDGDGVTAFIYGYIDKGTAPWLHQALQGETLNMSLDERMYAFSLEGSKAAIDTAFTQCNEEITESPGT
ncbi:MAG: hypothetical protein JSW10_08415 [Pseudomonadota bacterium]|nr:MAG: hypothetical protein JSW10_08415 [Pseudomonadota bacterium]